MSRPHGFLREAALKAATLRSYDKNLHTFLHYTRLSLQQLLSLSAARIDQLFASFVERQFSIGGSFGAVSHALSSLVFRCPSLRHQLGESKLCLRGWSRLRRCSSHPPITWELTVLFAVTMAKWGCHAHGVAALLAFDCYLRVGELTRLRYSDVVQPSDPRVGAAHVAMALRLPVTKTGLNQWVSVRSPAVARVLHRYLQSHEFTPTALIFPFGPAQFRDLLKSVSVALGVGHIPYVPHSFRHGGATADYLRGHTVEQIMFHGRWASMTSARRYIQSGPALLASLDLPQRLHDIGAALESGLADIMDALGRVDQTRGSASSRHKSLTPRRVRFEDEC
jgi:integrase